ncbi:MAG TPA: cupredoxin domain-containing protein [Caulobacteraceae bacterium]|nr:cupredoxin domain-containing protein [Caulobacteraceae bacterium]
MPAAQPLPVRPLAAVAALAMLLAAAPAPEPWGGVAEAVAARSVAIKIANFEFNPGVTSVTAGTAVTWTNNDDDAHSVVADDRSFRSNPLDTGDSYTFTFATPGTYAYHCGLHPQMVGKIVVTR